MMQNFQQLRGLLELYITQNYPKGHRFTLDAETYAFFLDEARQGKGKRLPPPAPKPDLLIEEAPSASYSHSPAPKAPPLKAQAPAKLPEPKVLEATATLKAPEKLPKTPTAAATKAPAKSNAPTATVRSSKTFALEPLPTPPEDTLSDVRELVRQLFPSLSLVNTPLDDKSAVEIKNSWLKLPSPAKVLIASGNEPEEHLTFLEAMANGISQKLAPARSISIGALPPFEEIRLLIITRSVKGKVNATGLFPVIVLDEIDSYLQNPSLKRQLWNQICHHVAASAEKP